MSQPGWGAGARRVIEPDGDRHALIRWIAEANAITVLTGAGVSTDSGIPDFRGPNGVWTRNPGSAATFSLQNYVSDPQARQRAWQTRRDHPAWTARPNAAHIALVDLERTGRLRAIVTQNIDGLHQRAGSSPERVVELHGTLSAVMCLSCGERSPMRAALQRVEAGEADPDCRRCGGILKSATISFGQALDPATVRAAVAAALKCDLFLAIGTSLTVQPAAGLVDVARSVAARVVIVNGQPTAYDVVADLVIREPIGEIIPAVVAAAGSLRSGQSRRP
jgi:NAD-dependent deacetylase